jgi:hypothetical protein
VVLFGIDDVDAVAEAPLVLLLLLVLVLVLVAAVIFGNDELVEVVLSVVFVARGDDWDVFFGLDNGICVGDGDEDELVLVFVFAAVSVAAVAAVASAALVAAVITDAISTRDATVGDARGGIPPTTQHYSVEVKESEALSDSKHRMISNSRWFSNGQNLDNNHQK